MVKVRCPSCIALSLAVVMLLIDREEVRALRWSWLKAAEPDGGKVVVMVSAAVLPRFKIRKSIYFGDKLIKATLTHLSPIEITFHVLTTSREHEREDESSVIGRRIRWSVQRHSTHRNQYRHCFAVTSAKEAFLSKRKEIYPIKVSKFPIVLDS